jgi:FkbM family methyltransferase
MLATHINPLTATQRMMQAALMRIRPAPLASRIKRAIGIKRVAVTTVNGIFAVDPVSVFGLQITKFGVYEPAMIATLRAQLHPGATFVDIGANEGYITTIGAEIVGSRGRVLAIEPQTRLLPVIAENLRLNGILWVDVANICIGDVPGLGQIHLAADTNTGSSGIHRASSYRTPTQSVAIKTLDQAIDDAKLGRIDLMKVDIEGFEYEAVLGSPMTFQSHRVRALALELHPALLAARGKAAADITALLSGCGYQRINDVWTAP